MPGSGAPSDGPAHAMHSAATSLAHTLAALHADGNLVEIALTLSETARLPVRVGAHSRHNPDPVRHRKRISNLQDMLKKTAKLAWAVIATCWAFTAFAADIDAEAEMQAGLDAWQSGDMIGALRHYHVAAEAGIALAQAKLGYIYDQSNDDEKAVHWYSEAAKQQHPDGEYGLGEMYSKGEGVDQDFEIAIEMYMRAAVGGHAQARRVLAKAYEHGGLGREVSLDEALRWLTLAANSGDLNAMERMVSLYTDGGLGVKPDPAEAQQWQARVDAAQAE